jgi:hypothetical protein
LAFRLATFIVQIQWSGAFSPFNIDSAVRQLQPDFECLATRDEEKYKESVIHATFSGVSR